MTDTRQYNYKNYSDQIMGVFKKIKAKAKSNRGEAEDMLVAQFLDENWADYVDQVKGMSAEERAEIKADFDGTGLEDAMADEFDTEDAETLLSTFKMTQADCSEEQIKQFCAKLTEKYWDPRGE